MESRHCGQDKRIFLCPVHNASTPCSLQAFGIKCMDNQSLNTINELCPMHSCMFHDRAILKEVVLAYSTINATKWNNNNIFLAIHPSNTWKLYLDHQLQFCVLVYFIDLRHRHKAGSLFQCFSMNSQLCLNV